MLFSCPLSVLFSTRQMCFFASKYPSISKRKWRQKQGYYSLTFSLSSFLARHRIRCFTFVSTVRAVIYFNRRIVFSRFSHPKAYKIFFSSMFNFKFIPPSCLLFAVLPFSLQSVPTQNFPSVSSSFSMPLSWHYFPRNGITCGRSFNFQCPCDTEILTK